jgi:hypothetical protein
MNAKTSRSKRIYNWLVEQNAFSGIVGSVLFPLILAPLVLWLTSEVRSRRDQDQERVCLNIPVELADYDFYLRYVREGPGGWRGDGPLYNEDILFKDDGSVSQGFARKRCATIRYARHYGVQFKPFISIKGKPLTVDRVADVLKTAGFTDISKDGMPGQNNVWFLLPQYSNIEDKGNAIAGHAILNNFIAR